MTLMQRCSYVVLWTTLAVIGARSHGDLHIASDDHSRGLFPQGQYKLDLASLVRGCVGDASYLSHSVSGGIYSSRSPPVGSPAPAARDTQRSTHPPCFARCKLEDQFSGCKLDCVCLLNCLARSSYWSFQRRESPLGETTQLLSCDNPLRFHNHINKCVQDPTCELANGFQSTRSGRDARVSGRDLSNKPAIPSVSGRDLSNTSAIPSVSGRDLSNGEENVIVVVDRPCPGRCQVRNADGSCVTDFHCASQDV